LIGVPPLLELGDEEELKTWMESSSLKFFRIADSDEELLLDELKLLSTRLLWVTVDLEV
jgi:hypothetical protein